MKTKLLLLLCLFFAMSLAAHSQVYMCTANGVKVRTGPGTNYPVLNSYAQGSNYSVGTTLEKGCIVGSDGRQRNGFIHVEDLAMHQNFGDGWVSAKYLVKMTKKCPSCRGRGYFNRPCSNCDGYGCWVCAVTNGLDRCDRCVGLGVIP